MDGPSDMNFMGYRGGKGFLCVMETEEFKLSTSVYEYVHKHLQARKRLMGINRITSLLRLGLMMEIVTRRVDQGVAETCPDDTLVAVVEMIEARA